MCQGDKKTGTIGTYAIFAMDPKDVPNIPKDKGSKGYINKEKKIIQGPLRDMASLLHFVNHHSGFGVDANINAIHDEIKKALGNAFIASRRREDSEDVRSCHSDGDVGSRPADRLVILIGEDRI